MRRREVDSPFPQVGGTGESPPRLTLARNGISAAALELSVATRIGPTEDVGLRQDFGRTMMDVNAADHISLSADIKDRVTRTDLKLLTP